MSLSPVDIETARNQKFAHWHQRRRAELWIAQDGLCFWCGRETVMPFQPGYYRPHTPSISGKAATLDHLRSKLSGNPTKSHERDGFVMACSTCNGQRSKREHERLLVAAAGMRGQPWTNDDIKNLVADTAHAND